MANQHSIDQINDLLVLSLSLSVQMSIYSCRRYLSFDQNHFLKIMLSKAGCSEPLLFPACTACVPLISVLSVCLRFLDDDLLA